MKTRDDETTAHRTPMPIDLAYQWGKTLRLAGWSEVEVGGWLAEMGYSPSGTTARRIRRGYEAIHED